MYYLKTHKKCATAKSKAKLSAAEKRLIDERQDAGGTQPQEETAGLPVPSLRKTGNHVNGKKISRGKKIDAVNEENEEEDEEEDEDEGECEEELEMEEDQEGDYIESDSSASYTPRNQVIVSMPAKKKNVAVLMDGVNRVVMTQRKNSKNTQDKFAKKYENDELIRFNMEETERKVRAAKWEANLPPRMDHPDARGEDV